MEAAKQLLEQNPGPPADDLRKLKRKQASPHDTEVFVAFTEIVIQKIGEWVLFGFGTGHRTTR